MAITVRRATKDDMPAVFQMIKVRETGSKSDIEPFAYEKSLDIIFFLIHFLLQGISKLFESIWWSAA